MKEPVFEADRALLSEEVIRAGSDHEIEFEGGAQVALAYIGDAHSRSTLNERNGAGAGREVVTKRGCNPCQVARGLDLSGAKRLTAKLPIPTPPTIRRNNVGEDPAGI